MNPKRIARKSLMVGLMILFLSSYALGQEDGLSITGPGASGAYLSLGMSEAVAMEKLKEFQLSRIPGSNSYGIAVKTKDSYGDLYSFVGSITCTDKKLTLISSKWYESQNDKHTFELADKLYYLFKEKMNSSGEVKATINVKSFRDPDKELKTIEITAGNKRISILITDSEKHEWGRQVSIHEAISSKPFK